MATTRGMFSMVLDQLRRLMMLISMEVLYFLTMKILCDYGLHMETMAMFLVNAYLLVMGGEENRNHRIQQR